MAVLLLQAKEFPKNVQLHDNSFELDQGKNLFIMFHNSQTKLI
jgi:hypothetical protein